MKTSFRLGGNVSGIQKKDALRNEEDNEFVQAFANPDILDEEKAALLQSFCRRHNMPYSGESIPAPAPDDPEKAVSCKSPSEASGRPGFGELRIGTAETDKEPAKATSSVSKNVEEPAAVQTPSAGNSASDETAQAGANGAGDTAGQRNAAMRGLFALTGLWTEEVIRTLCSGQYGSSALKRLADMVEHSGDGLPRVFEGPAKEDFEQHLTDIAASCGYTVAAIVEAALVRPDAEGRREIVRRLKFLAESTGKA